MKLSTAIGLLLCVLSIPPNFLHAQIVGTKPDIRSTNKRVGMFTGFDVFNNPLDEDDPIVGSPYYKDEYSKGTIVTTLGPFNNSQLRYNVYLDQVEFKERDSVFALGPDSIINRIRLGQNILIVEKLMFKGKMRNTFFVRLDSGRVMLMAKPSVVFRERQEARPIEIDGKPPAYIRNGDEYFIKVGKGLPSKITGMKSFIDNLPDKKKEMEEYARRQKLSPRDEQDLMELIRHYNSL